MILSLPAFYEAVGPSVRPAEFAVRPVDRSWPDDVVEMGGHLQETIDGTPKSIKTSTAGGPRLEYDPKTTKARDRVAAKAAELAGTSLATSERSLWRLRATYAEGGLASLAERKHLATAQTLATAHVNPDVLAIIHFWRASVAGRTEGGRCPYCAGQRAIPGETDLATRRPDIAAQWHPGNDLAPDQVMPYSRRRIVWQCSRGHLWEARIANRDRPRVHLLRGLARSRRDRSRRRKRLRRVTSSRPSTP